MLLSLQGGSICTRKTYNAVHPPRPRRFLGCGFARGGRRRGRCGCVSGGRKQRGHKGRVAQVAFADAHLFLNMCKEHVQGSTRAREGGRTERGQRERNIGYVIVRMLLSKSQINKTKRANEPMSRQECVNTNEATVHIACLLFFGARAHLGAPLALEEAQVGALQAHVVVVVHLRTQPHKRPGGAGWLRVQTRLALGC